MPNAYYWWLGGREGGQKSQKPAYVIHGCPHSRLLHAVIWQVFFFKHCKIEFQTYVVWHWLAKTSVSSPKRGRGDCSQKNLLIEGAVHKLLTCKLFFFIDTYLFLTSFWQIKHQNCAENKCDVVIFVLYFTF